jgi:amidohydrolase
MKHSGPATEHADPQAVRAATTLRRALHRVPEISNHETGTARAIVEFVRNFSADEVIVNLGGAGVAVIYQGFEAGPTVMIRSELDALPIDEANDFAHRSVCDHVSHKCGHDGHMAMVAGLAPLLMRQPPARGRVVLLFQPAEETGEGAAAVRSDARFASIAPDYSFALHNLPGHPLHQIVVRDGTFTMGSVGMSAVLEGRTSHASEPEKGVSPARALDVLLRELPALPSAPDLDGFTLVTLTHMKLGERSFGISPGKAEVLATLRAEKDADLQKLRQRAAALIARTAQDNGLLAETQWSDQFAATVNHPDAVRHIHRAADFLGLNTLTLPDPIRWSEDFGLFTQVSTGALLGLGSGVNHAALHSPDYDFPDELIPTGIALFGRIITQLLGSSGAR